MEWWLMQRYSDNIWQERTKLLYEMAGWFFLRVITGTTQSMLAYCIHYDHMTKPVGAGMLNKSYCILRLGLRSNDRSSSGTALQSERPVIGPASFYHASAVIGITIETACCGRYCKIEVYTGGTGTRGRWIAHLCGGRAAGKLCDQFAVVQPCRMLQSDKSEFSAQYLLQGRRMRQCEDRFLWGGMLPPGVRSQRSGRYYWWDYVNKADRAFSGIAAELTGQRRRCCASRLYIGFS